jgi:hypothetical protein
MDSIDIRLKSVFWNVHEGISVKPEWDFFAGDTIAEVIVTIG